MNKEQKILNYIFPNDEIRAFLCNDLFIELNSVIPKNLCISKKNINNLTRLKNYNKVKLLITNFIQTNKIYIDRLTTLYNYANLSRIISEILTGYVFYFSKLNKIYKNFDIFNNSLSICYNSINFFDSLF